MSIYIHLTRNAVTLPHSTPRELQFISINIIGRLLRKLRSSITYPKHIESTRVSDSAISYIHIWYGLVTLYSPSLNTLHTWLYIAIVFDLCMYATSCIGCIDGFLKLKGVMSENRVSVNCQSYKTIFFHL